MFVHMVLFEINPREVSKYHHDCKIWATYAKEAKGFLGYSTIKRVDFKNQYASVYRWQTKSLHDRFMKKFHDYLVSKSKAKVKVLGYYNLKTVKEVLK